MNKIDDIKIKSVPIAHSFNDLQVEQPYTEHACNVRDRALECFDNMKHFFKGSPKELIALRNALYLAATYHDLGKLDSLSQNILHNDNKGKMLNHVDAGTAYMFDCFKSSYEKGKRDVSYFLAAILIDAHHIGLMNKKDENGEYKDLELNDLKDSNVLRDEKKVIDRNKEYKTLVLNEDEIVREYVNRHLKKWIDIHDEEVRNVKIESIGSINLLSQTLVLRFLLSCLVEGDHWDTARHYNEIVTTRTFLLQPQKRLEEHIKRRKDLPIGSTDNEKTRNKIRNLIFDDSMNTSLDKNFYHIEATPGNGKTQAADALAKRLAIQYDLRKIFWVVPFSNIITQNVKEIKKYNVLPPMEKDSEIVGEHHQQANHFSKAKEDNILYKLLRQYNTLWKSPFIFTSSVQFFETMASNHPVKLRKFNMVPGSVIIIDEYHTAIPLKYLRQSFKWLRELVDKWSCKVIFLSGSPVRFWEIDEFSSCGIAKEDVNNVMSKKTIKSMKSLERKRIKYYSLKKPFTIDRLCRFVMKKSGPRVVICNTVFTAAVIANKFRLRYGIKKVMHISTAFCSSDREIQYNRIKERLKNKDDNNWVLIATSCIDTGVDFSFKVGFRESGSLMSLQQLAGRVNRNAELGEFCYVYDFRINHMGEGTTPNPAFSPSIKVLAEMFKNKKIKYSDCTEAIDREVKIRNSDLEEIEKYEKKLNFRKVSNKYHLIANIYHTVIVDKNIIDKVNNEPISYKELLNGSVQIYPTKLDREEFRQNIKEYNNDIIDKYEESKIKAPDSFNVWTGQYCSHFLGYMKEILDYMDYDVLY